MVSGKPMKLIVHSLFQNTRNLPVRIMCRKFFVYLYDYYFEFCGINYIIIEKLHPVLTYLSCEVW